MVAVYSLCSVFIIMYHSTVPATTLPVAVVCSASTTDMPVMMGPTSMGLAAVLGHCVVLPPPVILRDTMRGAVGLATVLQPHSPMPSQAYDHYAMGPQ